MNHWKLSRHNAWITGNKAENENNFLAQCMKNSTNRKAGESGLDKRWKTIDTWYRCTCPPQGDQLVLHTTYSTKIHTCRNRSIPLHPQFHPGTLSRSLHSSSWLPSYLQPQTISTQGTEGLGTRLTVSACTWLPAQLIYCIRRQPLNRWAVERPLETRQNTTTGNKVKNLLDTMDESLETF